MRKYEEYKHSGIDWLESIPSHWTINQIKRSLKLLTDYDANGSFSDIGKNVTRVSDDTKYAWFVRTTDLEKFYNNINLDNFIWIDEKSYNYLKKSKLYSGDLLLAKRGDIGKIYLMPKVDVPTSLAPNLYLARLNNKHITSHYAYYFLITDFGQKQLNLRNKSTTLGALYKDDFKSLEFPFPPLIEQQAIANYLDAKTQAIDKKVTLLEQKIETYKKLKRTLINQTITKGLDKKVPLKDSGISWIGQIPQHWEVKRLKDVCKSMSSGATPTSGNLSYYEDGTINWLNTGDLNDGIINSTQKKLNNSVFDDYPNLKIQKKGTLVIAMYGATIGKIGLLDIDSTTNQACCCLNFKNDNFNKFHFYQLLNIKQYIISLSVGGTQPNVSQGILSFIEMVVPPKSEQQEIANYLDHKTATIDAIVSNIGKQIDTLKQLRKTLINDVVTGKIKVCDD